MKLEVKPIPVPKGYVHTPPKYDQLPRHEFSFGIIAPKGSGKTTVICNLLNFYKGYFHSILIFSPTVASDEKWDWVKKMDLLADNTALKQWLKNKEPEDKNKVVQDPPKSMDTQISTSPLVDKKIPEECFYSDYDEDTLQEIMDEQIGIVRMLKKHGKSKHLANRMLIIFDDLVGSKLFSNKKTNPFKMLNTNHRHYSASLLMVTQA